MCSKGPACMVKYHTCIDWVWSYADLDWSPRGPISNKVIGIVSEKLLSANNQWYKEHYQNKHLKTEKGTNNWNFYRTRVRSLFTLVTHSLTDWLTDSLTHSCLVNLIDLTLVKMPTQNLLRLLLLLMFVMRIVLAIVCCRFGSWGLVIKLTFVQTLSILVKILKLRLKPDFEADVWSVFCCWCLVEVTKLYLGQYSEARFG